MDPLVLELGCGTGTFSKYLLEELPALRLVGSDISPRAIKIAATRCREYENVRFEVADGSAQPYAPNMYDSVIGCAVLHHLIPVAKALQECLRVLKPGGFIWFTEPNMMHPAVALEKNFQFIGRRLQSTDHETAFFRWSLAQTLQSLGFQYVSVEPYDFIPPIFPRRFLGVIDCVGRFMERMPVLRETAGHLLIRAYKSAGRGKPCR
jgi:ubiquinone/menaquinone biosynthesis C-methylase UbiE